MDSVLSEYSLACANQTGTNGALLTCVIGGKMSEGIDFKDGLGRGIIVVGMPYPNRSDPMLHYKMEYFAKLYPDFNTNEYYENICMKALNQSIGMNFFCCCTGGLIGS